MNEVIKYENMNNDKLSRSVIILEFEKNKLKLEIGKREEVHTRDEFESSSTW